MKNDITEPQPPYISPLELFLKFLRFGCLAFGGPVAQIAMVRQSLVDEEKWISSLRLIACLPLCRFYPAPRRMNYAFISVSLRGAGSAVFSRALGLCCPASC